LLADPRFFSEIRDGARHAQGTQYAAAAEGERFCRRVQQRSRLLIHSAALQRVESGFSGADEAALRVLRALEGTRTRE